MRIVGGKRDGQCIRAPLGVPEPESIVRCCAGNGPPVAQEYCSRHVVRVACESKQLIAAGPVPQMAPFPAPQIHFGFRSVDSRFALGLMLGEKFPRSTQIVRLQGFESLGHLGRVEALAGKAFLGLGSAQGLVSQAMLLSFLPLCPSGADRLPGADRYA